LHWALETYGPDVQSNYKETLLTAYFTDGLDVGDPTVLKICADRMDLDGTALESWLQTDNGTQAVLEDLQAAQDRDIMAVPSFVIDNRFLIPGAQDVDVFVNVLERALAR
jgi:predicted DsbA family dithiol-disulfide isomerase